MSTKQPFPSGPARPGGEDGHHSVEAPDRIREGGADLERSAVLVAGHRRHAGLRFEDRPPRRMGLGGTAVAVARQRHPDQPGIVLQQRLVIEAEIADRSGAEVVQDDVAGLHQVDQDLGGPRGFQVHAQAELVALHLVEDALAVPGVLAGLGVGKDPGPEGRPRQPAPLPVPVRFGRLEASRAGDADAAGGGMLEVDDLGAEVRQPPPGERAGPGDGELQHPDTRQDLRRRPRSPPLRRPPARPSCSYGAGGRRSNPASTSAVCSPRRGASRKGASAAPRRKGRSGIRAPPPIRLSPASSGGTAAAARRAPRVPPGPGRRGRGAHGSARPARPPTST